MNRIVVISLLGFLGANIRFMVGSTGIFSNMQFPFATFLLNILGSFILAFVLSLSLSGRKLSKTLEIGIVTGFCGSLTTFSTLCKQVAGLLNKNDIQVAVIYIIFSVMIGLLAVFMAYKVHYLLRKG